MKPSKEEHREETVERFFEKRHQAAVTAYHIEELLSSVEWPAFSVGMIWKGRWHKVMEEIKQLTAQLPLRWKQIYPRLIKQYLESFGGIRDAERMLTKCAEQEGSWEGEQWEGKDKRGLEVFRRATGKEPSDWVGFDVREGYGVLYFMNAADYAVFCATAKPSNEHQGEVMGKNGSAGVFVLWWFSEMKREIPLIAYYENMTVSPQEYGRYFKDLLEHERQHFINNVVLRDFLDVEPIKTKPQTVADRLLRRAWIEDEDRVLSDVAVKNEVMAYIRDGSGGASIRNLATDPMYACLMESYPQEERPAITKLLEEIADELDRSFNYHPRMDDQGRAVFTYGLVDVPLRRLPEWLRRLDDFYEKRSKKIEETFFPAQDLLDVVYEQPLQDKADALKPVAKELSEAQGKALLACHGSGAKPGEDANALFEKRLADVRSLRKKYDEAVKSLGRKGVRAPHAWEHVRNDWLLVVEDKIEGRYWKPEESRARRQEIVDHVSRVPQDRIDSLFVQTKKEMAKRNAGTPKVPSDLIGEWVGVFSPKDTGVLEEVVLTESGIRLVYFFPGLHKPLICAVEASPVASTVK